MLFSRSTARDWTSAGVCPLLFPKSGLKKNMKTSCHGMLRARRHVRRNAWRGKRVNL
jgi:hypothetical protein